MGLFLSEDLLRKDAAGEAVLELKLEKIQGLLRMRDNGKM